ncbi:XK-related protein 6 [Anopheles sinensis]|uniref:XK-related protein 6 n=1 Tax=Anopheles sinensis TaxID=74873 RepID=A0A084VJG7_ANOSI|nr:XK-related protein 6 [Anopheles sinensis]
MARERARESEKDASERDDTARSFFGLARILFSIESSLRSCATLLRASFSTRRSAKQDLLNICSALRSRFDDGSTGIYRDTKCYASPHPTSSGGEGNFSGERGNAFDCLCVCLRMSIARRTRRSANSGVFSVQQPAAVAGGQCERRADIVNPCLPSTFAGKEPIPPWIEQEPVDRPNNQLNPGGTSV